MQVITSSVNQIIKDSAAHKSGKSCFALLEGENLINEAIARKACIEKLFVLEKMAQEFRVITELAQQNGKTSVYFVADNVLHTLCDTKTPQGIVALTKINQKSIVKKMSACSDGDEVMIKSAQPDTDFLVLDNIQDPGNMGAILRSALGAGFCDIYMLNCVSVTNPKVIRASMGAVLALNLYNTSEELLSELLSEAKLPLFMLDMTGGSIFNFTAPKRLGLAIGNEGKGISQKVKKICSGAIAIPMKGKLESLNAAVAAGIAMFVLGSRI